MAENVEEAAANLLKAIENAGPAELARFHVKVGLTGSALAGSGAVNKIFMAQLGALAGVAPVPEHENLDDVDISDLVDEDWQPGIECEHGYDACPICDAQG